MGQNAEKVGSGVPGFNNGLEDEQLHASLAKANLMRLRGDFAEAERICVSVLASYPESAAAHTLLGDIAFSQDHAEQAIEHYEIAGQLDPVAPDVPRKLEDAKAMLQHRETATTAEQLGLPSKPAVPWTSIGFGALAALALGAAIVAGLAAYPKGNGHRSVVADPIVATSDTVAPSAKREPSVEEPKSTVVEEKPRATETTPGSTSSSSPVAGGLPLEDQTLHSLIQQRSTQGSHLLNVISDPRTHQVTLTYSVGSEEDARAIGAQLAKDALDQSGDSLIVTLRGVRDQRLTYMADVPRTRYADTMAEAWQRSNTDPGAWMTYIVTNEWTYRPPETSNGAPKTP